MNYNKICTLLISNLPLSLTQKYLYTRLISSPKHSFLYSYMLSRRERKALYQPARRKQATIDFFNTVLALGEMGFIFVVVVLVTMLVHVLFSCKWQINKTKQSRITDSDSAMRHQVFLSNSSVSVVVYQRDRKSAVVPDRPHTRSSRSKAK